MDPQRDWTGVQGKGRAEARATLAHIQADIAWLAENWERLGVDGCLSRLAGARRGLSAAGAALLRDHFVEALSGNCMEPGDPQRILDLMYRLPGGHQTGPVERGEWLHGPG